MTDLPPPRVESAPIVITAPALPDPAAAAAYDVQQIGAAQIRTSATRQLEQLLLDVPGVQLFRRSDARSGHPTSQGITLRSLGGNASSRALVVLDGVPQSDPFGGWITWPALDLGAVGKVRVIRGGGSVAYGPGALAGTIDIASRTLGGMSGSIAAGSRGSFDARALLGAGGFGLSATYARSDGFIPVTKDTRGAADRRAPYALAAARATWQQSLSGVTDLQLAADGFVDRRDRGVAFTGDRTRGADASARLVGSGDWQWSALGYAQWRTFRSSFASVDEDRTTASRVALQDAVPSSGYGASVELRPPIRGVEWRIGADGRLTTGESRELYLYTGGDPARRRIVGGQSFTVGLFTELSKTIGRATLTGGARIDRWSISDGKLRESVIAGNTVLRNDRFKARGGWLPTARAAMLIDVGSGFSLRSAAYLGWRMPTLNELFRPFRAGPDATAANAGLDPEKLAGAEAGARFDKGPYSVSVTAFANRLSNAIANVTLSEGPGIFPGVGFVGAGGLYRQRMNLDSIAVQGVELSARWAQGSWWAAAGASFADAKVRASGPAAALGGLRPAQVPRTAATVQGGWSNRHWEASATLRRVGNQYEEDLNRLRLPPATTLDVFGAVSLGRQLQLVARAENLFDEQVVAGLDNDGTTERATPRTLWIELRLRP